jgi:hypothetical protein
MPISAIFDLKGKCLSSSEKERSIPADEAVTICKYLGSEFQGLTQPHFGLFFGDIRYMCFRVTKNTSKSLTGEIIVSMYYTNIYTFTFDPNHPENTSERGLFLPVRSGTTWLIIYMTVTWMYIYIE